MTVTPDDSQMLRSALRADLLAAMKAREAHTVSALRTAIAAFDNAEAVAAPDQPRPVVTSEYVAGSAVGLGAAEATRRDLSNEDLRGLLREQVVERLAEAERYESGGRFEAAARLRREADVLRRYLPR